MVISTGLLFNTYKRVYTTSDGKKMKGGGCLIPIKEYIQQDYTIYTELCWGCLIPIKEYIQQDCLSPYQSSYRCLIPIKEYIQQYQQNDK